MTPLQREINANTATPSKYVSQTPKADSEETTTSSIDHIAFLHREKKRVDHYLSPECAGFYPRRSEYLGNVMASTNGKNVGSNVLMSPLRTFMYNTSSGFNSLNQQQTPQQQCTSLEPVEGFQFTKFKHFNKFHTRASEFLLHSTHHKIDSGLTGKDIRSPILKKVRMINNHPQQRLKQLLEGSPKQ